MTKKKLEKQGIIDPGIEFFIENIGKKVYKNTSTDGSQPKPFKSKSKVNTVKDIIIHPIINVPAYTFEEDDSYVQCTRCTVIEDMQQIMHIEDHERCGNCGGILVVKDGTVKCTTCKFSFCY